MVERARRIDPELKKKMEPWFRKTTLTMRLSEGAKSEIRAAAQSLGLTVTAYLWGAHRAVKAELLESKESRPDG